MMDSQPALEHLSQPQDLGQLPVIYLEAGDGLVEEYVNLALLGVAGQVHFCQAVSQLVHLLL